MKIAPRVRKAGVGPDEEKTNENTEMPMREAFRDTFEAEGVAADEAPRRATNIFGPLYASSFRVKLPAGTQVLHRGCGLFGLPTITMVSIQLVVWINKRNTKAQQITFCCAHYRTARVRCENALNV